jgi:hypothetical protein
MPEFPEYFLVRVKLDTGWHLVTCRALSTINETRLPGDIATAVSREFDHRRKDDLQVIELPPPGDSDGWIAMQMSIPIPRPIPRP